MKVKPKILFTEDGHKYTVNNEEVVSVTKMLKIIELNDYSWCREEDLRFGKYMHDTFNFFYEGNLDEDSLHQSLKDRLTALKSWIDLTGWVSVERNNLLYSNKFNLCGCDDDVGYFTKLKPKLNNKLTVLDYKSGQLNVGTLCQVGGYKIMENEYRGKKDKILLAAALSPHANRKFSYRIWEGRESEQAFMTAYSYYKMKGRKI